jgi:hypothetical protein
VLIRQIELSAVPATGLKPGQIRQLHINALTAVFDFGVMQVVPRALFKTSYRGSARIQSGQLKKFGDTPQEVIKKQRFS